MGTRRKLLLASLVSLTMVIAFGIGLMPSTIPNGTEAKDAGQVDMVDLLDMILGKQAEGITLQSGIEGVIVKTPVDNAETPEIPVPVQAFVPGATSEKVTFVANVAGDDTAFPQANRWAGDVFSSPVDFPFVSAIDVSPFLTGTVNLTGTSLAIYALTNAVQVGKAATLSYQAANAPEDIVQLLLIETPPAADESTLDGDRNGFPDNIFDDINPGEIWVTNVMINGVLRTVMVANLDNSASKQGALGDVFVSPSGNITVQSPNLADFHNAGVIPSTATGYLIVEVVDSLGGLLDQVNGNADPAGIQAWAQVAMDKAPGALTGAGQFVEVSLVYSLNSGTSFAEIDSLEGSGLNVSLTMTGLDVAENDNVQLWSYPTAIGGAPGNYYIANDAAAASEWSMAEGASVAAGVLNATLTSFSVFAPFNSGLSLLSADPAVVPQGYAADVTLTGIIPLATAMNVAEASAAYSVTVGGQAAAFRLGPAKQTEAAITADSPNSIYITVPALEVTGDVDVTITDLNVPANTFTAASLLEVREVFAVTTQVTGSTTASIALNPASGAGLPAGSYMSGTSVAATLTYDSGVENFLGWTLNGTPYGTAATVNFTVDQPITLAAALEAISAGYTLTVESTAGGSVNVDPAPDLPNNRYTPGTTVTLTAVSDNPALFQFAGWTGQNAADLSDSASATATITMNGDKVVRANFAGVTYALTVSVNPQAGGSVTQLPLPDFANRYAANQEVSLQATAAEGYEFSNWTGDVANANLAATTIVMNADKAVTANFTPIESANGWVPQAGDEDGRAVVWVFGGVVRTLTGTGLTDNTSIYILGQRVQGFRAAANGTSVDVVIPPYANYSEAMPAQEDVDVVVGEAPNQTTLPILRYRRFYTDANGINTTSFMFNSAATTAQNVSLGGADFGELELPALETTGRTLYGIARNVQLTDITAKANTSVLASMLGTGSITAAESGNQIPNAFDFAFYLYAPEAGKNTPPAGSAAFGSALRADGSSVFTIPPAVDAQGNANPLSSPALLTLPVNSAFTYDDVRKGLSMWGQASEYDYATNALVALPTPVEVAYQSQLLANEVDPAMTSASAGSPVNIDKARLYSLNGFSLRKGALLPEDVTDLIRLATASGTASGDVAGGTSLKVVSPLGGLGYVEKIVLKSASKAINVTAMPTTAAGTTENVVEFKAPKASEPGITDLVIYLKSAPTTPAVTLERVFEYTRASKPLDSLLLIALGLLVALIGLAAGGESGGGGGGPCFIATAAYGTPLAAEIDTLRAVRDNYLLDNAIGTALVDTYYQVSPPVADVVAKSPLLAALVRVLLVPVIFLGKVALAMPTLTAFVGLSLGVAFMLRRRARGRA